MKTIIVLAAHGAPPNDFPRHEINEIFGLKVRLLYATGKEREAMGRRHDELDEKIRTWPRTAKNDPFYAGTQEIAAHLNRATGCEVMVGFNDFCIPCLDEAFDKAIAQGAEKIIVITPMMTRGGEHTEVDIPAAIKCAQERHPDIPIIYIWPFEVSKVAEFLAAQIPSL
jgi:sirohydrochlorin cobaltochelatase